MLTAVTISAGAAGSQYYSKDNYYISDAEGRESGAEWFGKGAEAHGLKGDVASERFDDLLQGYTPDGEKRMGHEVNGEHRHRPGLDLTFSASKSASIAALVYGDQRIVEAHDAAVKAALKIVEEKFAQTRVQKDGEMQTVTGVPLIAGIFRHETTRLFDPGLHSHTAIANMVETAPGHWSALHNDKIFKYQRVLTEAYRGKFEFEANERGIATERGKYGEVNIIGVSQDLIDGFSKRRQEILAYVKENDLASHAASQQVAALKTRLAKQDNVDRKELYASWREEAKQYGLKERDVENYFAQSTKARETDYVPQLDTTPKIYRDARAVVDALTGAEPRKEHANDLQIRMGLEKAIEHVSSRSAVYSRADLTEAAMRFTNGAVNYARLDAAMERALDQGQLIPAAKDRITQTAPLDRNEEKELHMAKTLAEVTERYGPQTQEKLSQIMPSPSHSSTSQPSSFVERLMEKTGETAQSLKALASEFRAGFASFFAIDKAVDTAIAEKRVHIASRDAEFLTDRETLSQERAILRIMENGQGILVSTGKIAKTTTHQSDCSL